MKYLKQYPLLFMMALCLLFLAGAGLSGKDSLYADYRQEGNPYNPVAWALVGVKNGVMPWEAYREGHVTAFADALSAGGLWTKDGPDGQAQESEAQQSDPQDETGKPEEPESGIQESELQERADGPVTEENSAEAQESVETQETSYEFVQADESYFDDALFIGDSRTVGLWEYAGMEERADFFCKTSLTVWDVLEKPFVKAENGRMITVEQALGERSYGKIYLMVGINELGRGNTELFMEQYRLVVDRIRELQPEAVLFVEGIMRVAGEKNRTDPIFNNEHINEKNEQIAGLADNIHIFYIDVNEAVCDENGNLTAEYTFDQIHLKAAYYQLWKDFLLEHAIVK